MAAPSAAVVPVQRRARLTRLTHFDDKQSVGPRHQPDMAAGHRSMRKASAFVQISRLVRATDPCGWRELMLDPPPALVACPCRFLACPQIAAPPGAPHGTARSPPGGLNDYATHTRCFAGRARHADVRWRRCQADARDRAAAAAGSRSVPDAR